MVQTDCFRICGGVLNPIRVSSSELIYFDRANQSASLSTYNWACGERKLIGFFLRGLIAILTITAYGGDHEK